MIGRIERAAMTPGDWFLCVMMGVMAVSFVLLPAAVYDENPARLIGGSGWTLFLIGAGVFVAGVAPVGDRQIRGVLLTAAAVLIGLAVVLRLWEGYVFAGAGLPALVGLAALTLVLWAGLSALARIPGRITDIAVPLLFGGILLFLWEVLALGYQVPRILLPAPTAVLAAISGNAPTLWIDFYQTFIRSVIPGYVMGCGAGFLVAVAIDRSPFLQRGLLPIGSMVSAMPIVGIAPIMVMWFGFDWESKAAVIIVMTFFPMMVNTLAGLQSVGAMERDLMRSYAASYPQTLSKLRLPGALPYAFNALKLNSTLALIGAIVAEFFGTPIYGMGFRISTEVARLNIDIVWATIAVAAVAGSASYGLLALLERKVTFWHPSQRSG